MPRITEEWTPEEIQAREKLREQAGSASNARCFFIGLTVGLVLGYVTATLPAGPITGPVGVPTGPQGTPQTIADPAPRHAGR